MSKTSAIAAVTLALQRLLERAVEGVVTGAVEGAEVKTLNPALREGAGDKPLVNIFLYSVAPNPSLRNAALPSRRPGGTPAQRPQAALDLFYLLSCYGTDGLQIDPQLLLGTVISALTAQPFLSADLIASATAETRAAGSGLEAQPESVRLTPLALSLEELSKLWSVFFQKPYALSTAYQASVVLIDADLVPSPALPAQRAATASKAGARPRITALRVLAPDDLQRRAADDPTLPGDLLELAGEGLAGDAGPGEVRVSVGEAMLAAEPLGPGRLRAWLAAPQLRAGVQGVRVLRQLPIGDPPAPHWLTLSDTAALVLHPTVTPLGIREVERDQIRRRLLLVRCTPGAGLRQRVALLLNEADPPEGRPAHAYMLEPEPREAPASAAAALRRAVALAGRYPNEPELSAVAAVLAAGREAVATAAGPGQVGAAMAAAIERVAPPGGAEGQRLARAAAIAVADSVEATDELMFDITPVHPSRYLLRLQLDGVESPLGFAGGHFAAPEVTIS